MNINVIRSREWRSLSVRRRALVSLLCEASPAPEVLRSASLSAASGSSPTTIPKPSQGHELQNALEHRSPLPVVVKSGVFMAELAPNHAACLTARSADVRPPRPRRPRTPSVFCPNRRHRVTLLMQNVTMVAFRGCPAGRPALARRRAAGARQWTRFPRAWRIAVVVSDPHLRLRVTK